MNRLAEAYHNEWLNGNLIESKDYFNTLLWKELLIDAQFKITGYCFDCFAVNILLSIKVDCLLLSKEEIFSTLNNNSINDCRNCILYKDIEMALVIQNL